MGHFQHSVCHPSAQPRFCERRDPHSRVCPTGYRLICVVMPWAPKCTHGPVHLILYLASSLPNAKQSSALTFPTTANTTTLKFLNTLFAIFFFNVFAFAIVHLKLKDTQILSIVLIVDRLSASALVYSQFILLSGSYTRERPYLILSTLHWAHDVQPHRILSLRYPRCSSTNGLISAFLP